MSDFLINPFSVIPAGPLSITGFGTKYSNPSTLPPGFGLSVALTTAANGVAVAHAASPFITAYPWSAGFGSKYANPGTLPTGDGRGVAFTTANNAIAVAHNNSPWVSAYPLTN